MPIGRSNVATDVPCALFFRSPVKHCEGRIKKSPTSDPGPTRGNAEGNTEQELAGYR